MSDYAVIVARPNTVVVMNGTNTAIAVNPPVSIEVVTIAKQGPAGGDGPPGPPGDVGAGDWPNWKLIFENGLV